MATQLAAAAAGIRPLVTGPAVGCAVLGSFSHAVIIEVPTRTGSRVVSLLTVQAAGVPCGVRVAGAIALPQFDRGTPALVGDGRVVLDGIDIRVVRWWNSRVPVIRPVPGGLAALRAAAGQADRGVDDRPVEALREALEEDRSSAGRRTNSTLGVAIDGLVGLGRGLTPGGDDVVAGLLSALHSLGHRDIVDRIRSRLQGLTDRTTTLSADLLRLAVDGHACSEALVALRSLGSPDTRRTAAAVGRLLSIGHTSGADLATGMAVGFEFAMTPHGRDALARSGSADVR